MSAILAVTDLHVRLGAAEVVRGVSVRADRGEVVAIVGPNGSGKTTLLRASLGLVPRVAGEVKWQGDAKVVDDPPRLASAACYLPQTPTPLPQHRAGEVIAMGRFHLRDLGISDSPYDRAAVARAAQMTNVEGLLTRRMRELSGGQRQRVFLARCLAQGSPGIVLDEPATFLDIRHQIELFDTLRTLTRREGRAVLMTSHDLNLAGAYADRVIVFDEGAIVAEGTPGDVFQPELLASVFDVEVRRVDVEGRPTIVPIGVA